MSNTDSPTPKSPQPDLAGNGSSAIPSDPLLQPGSFIDSTTVSNSETETETLNSNEAPNPQAIPAEPLQARRFSDDGVAPASAAPDSTTHVPTPENTESSAEPKSRRKRASNATISSERPDWLPSGWVVEDRVRASGATAGSVDKYYFDPVSSRRFRSKKEVMYFLETGSIRKRKNEPDGTPSESPGSQKKKKSSSKAKKEVPLNFDFHNVPEKIKWVLTDSAEGTWTPFAGEAKVPESTKKDWVAAFTSLTVKNGGHIAF